MLVSLDFYIPNPKYVLKKEAAYFNIIKIF